MLHRWWFKYVTLGLMLGLMIGFVMKNGETPGGKLRRGEYVAALASLAENKTPGAQALALRLGLRLAVLSADVQLLNEYQLNSTNVSSLSGAQDALQARVDKLIIDVRADSMALQQDAKLFKDAYKRGQKLVPWRGMILRRHISEAKLNDAMLALKGGDVDSKYFKTFETGVSEVAVLSSIGQLAHQENRMSVSLSREFDLPTLLFAVGTKVDDKNLVRWYMTEVLELTKEDADHPVRSMALQYLGA